MPYVHTTQVINDTKDILQVLNPIISDIDLRSRGKYREGKLQELLDDAKSGCEDSRHKGNFEKYFLYNEDISKKLRALSQENETIIFSTGVSVNLSSPYSGIPRKIATDPFMDSFALTTRLIEKYIDNPKVYQDVMVIPVSPIIFPYVFGNQGINHAAMEIVYGVDSLMIDEGKKGFGSLDKSLTSNGNVASFEFYEESFSLERRLYHLRKSPQEFREGESFDEIVERIGYENLLNNLIMINAFGNLIDIMGLREVNLFAMQTSYAKRIIVEACASRKIRFHSIGGKEGCMRNTEMSIFGESDPSAINIFNGYLVSKDAH